MNTKERLLNLSYEHKLSHLGSTLTAIDIIDAVYQLKKPEDRFVLSSGHAGLALYVVLEKYGYGDAQQMLEEQGIHPDRSQDTSGAIDCSTGSLGQGLPIAAGMALADREHNVYCLISDGECAEGSIWESLRLGQEMNLTNLRILLNANNWSAYKWVDVERLTQSILGFGWDIQIAENNTSDIVSCLNEKIDVPTLTIIKTNSDQYPFLHGLDAHYHVMTKEEYESTK